MFVWYHDAVACYAYLADIPGKRTSVEEVLIEDGTYHRAFENSRWFTRGWCLQELLAPQEVIFFSSNWSSLGTRHQLRRIIAQVTRIRENILAGSEDIQAASVSERMSRASDRQTTRKEDIAYCLMGLFKINMPLLYGEGDKAFLRLQEEIMKNTDDQTIFAWTDPNLNPESQHGLLAPHPKAFKDSSHFVSLVDAGDEAPHSSTSKGISVMLPLAPENNHSRNQLEIHRYFKATLRCVEYGLPDHFAVLVLYRLAENGSQYVRVDPHQLQRSAFLGTVQQAYVRQARHRGFNQSFGTRHFYPFISVGHWDVHYSGFFTTPGTDCRLLAFEANKVPSTTTIMNNYRRYAQRDTSMYEFDLPWSAKTAAVMVFLRIGGNHMVSVKIGTDDFGKVGYLLGCYSGSKLPDATPVDFERYFEPEARSLTFSVGTWEYSVSVEVSVMDALGPVADYAVDVQINRVMRPRRRLWSSSSTGVSLASQHASRSLENELPSESDMADGQQPAPTKPQRQSRMRFRRLLPLFT